jgi:hypothetical protein
MTFPVLYQGALGPGQDPAPPPAVPGGRGGLPRPGWPHKDSLDYAKVAIELALLLIALPWLLKKLFTRPGELASKAGRHHVS